jgi:predicted alpha/beta-hydrolase family hydrolase
MLAAVEPHLIDRLLLFSYPLHPPQRPGELRTGHFVHLRTPSLFIHGTRDGFGSVDEMTMALKLIPARTELILIDGAGHELRTRRNRDDLPKNVVKAFRSFADKVDADE